MDEHDIKAIGGGSECGICPLGQRTETGDGQLLFRVHPAHCGGQSGAGDAGEVPDRAGEFAIMPKLAQTLIQAATLPSAQMQVPQKDWTPGSEFDLSLGGNGLTITSRLSRLKNRI
jgi:hypothetical protein